MFKEIANALAEDFEARAQRAAEKEVAVHVDKKVLAHERVVPRRQPAAVWVKARRHG